MFGLSDFFFLIPELYLVFTAVTLLLLGTTLTTSSRLVLLPNFGYLTFWGFLLFGILCLEIPEYEYCLFYYQYVFTYFEFCARLLFLLLLLLILPLSINYFFAERIFFIEYFFLLSLFCVSSFILMAANDFIIFYFAIELQALILYTFAALKRYTVFSTESALKYFVLGALSSGFLLFGISLFYGFFGTFNFYDIKFLCLKWLGVKYFYTITTPIVFIFVGFLFKLAAAPFHIWVPDVYEGAPTVIVLFFATLPKLVMLVFLMKLFLV